MWGKVRRICGAHLGEILGVVKKGGVALTCRRGEKCRFKHGRLSDLTKEAATELASSMPSWMQECIAPAIADSRDFSNYYERRRGCRGRHRGFRSERSDS